MVKLFVALSLLLVCEAEPSRRLDDADCSDDPEWYHKNRGPDYDCAWVALKTDTRCAVKGVSGKVEGTIVASEACKAACGTCGGGGGGGDGDFSDDVDNVVFAHDSVLDDFLGETLLMVRSVRKSNFRRPTPSTRRRLHTGRPQKRQDQLPRLRRRERGLRAPVVHGPRL